MNSRYNQVGYNELSGYNEVIFGPIVALLTYMASDESSLYVQSEHSKPVSVPSRRIMSFHRSYSCGIMLVLL